MIKWFSRLINKITDGWKDAATVLSKQPPILSQKEFDEIYRKLKMTARATPHDIMDSDLWERYCQLTGVDVWAVNEGKMNGDEFVELPIELVEDYMARRKLRTENREKVR